ncbi:Translation initiation factor 6 [uncultured archaeon]|nr:Translation initiation factor 6 [uncultured archaeon]
MSSSKTSNFGNPHIGLFAKASEKLVAADISASPKFLLALESLGVPVEKVTISNSGLVGVYAAMNSNGVVLPPSADPKEFAVFKKYGLNVAKVPARFCAVGNNIAANDFGAVCNPEMGPIELKKVSDCLGVEAVAMRVAGYATTGACVAATNKGFAAHNRTPAEELKELQSVLKVPGENCTVNTGVAFVSLGAVANSHGALFGEACTGFEVGRVSGSLGLI